MDRTPGLQSQDSPASQTVQEYIVRIPKDKHKILNVMRFNHSLKVDATKWKQVKMERENNYKEFKLDDDGPKFGAGSEYGRDLKDEARRKKHGIITKKYNPDDQPWILKVGGKTGKKFKGIREGGVTENASYYVFTQAADGMFEAHPVEQWYNFTPIHCFKALSAEEAEEEFGRRDKVLNYFTIMVKKRLQTETADDDDDEEKKPGSKKKKKKKPKKEFKITDMDDWAHDLDDSGDSANEDDDDGNSNKIEKKGGKKKPKKENNSDDEAVEESDEGDFDDKEVDYITSSSGSEEEIEEEDEKANRELKGVEDEDAMRKNMSDDEEEEEKEENKETEETPEAKEKAGEQKNKPKKKSDTSGESSSESSDSDFDDPKFTSAIFVPNFQKSKKKNGSSDNSTGSSRANTPTKLQGDKEGGKGHKRKLSNLPSTSAKKIKIENSPANQSLVASTLDGITEDSVRRYLQRKPMTASELLHKFKSKKTKMSSDQLVNKLTDVLKKIPLQKNNIKGKMYLSLKNP